MTCVWAHLTRSRQTEHSRRWVNQLQPKLRLAKAQFLLLPRSASNSRTASKRELASSIRDRLCSQHSTSLWPILILMLSHVSGRWTAQLFWQDALGSSGSWTRSLAKSGSPRTRSDWLISWKGLPSCSRGPGTLTLGATSSPTWQSYAYLLELVSFVPHAMHSIQTLMIQLAFSLAKKKQLSAFQWWAIRRIRARTIRSLFVLHVGKTRAR